GRAFPAFPVRRKCGGPIAVASPYRQIARVIGRRSGTATAPSLPSPLDRIADSVRRTQQVQPAVAVERDILRGASVGKVQHRPEAKRQRGGGRKMNPLHRRGGPQNFDPASE
ncbi:hypothetical protein THAOC_32228, partial [Thalassiosira oceanica]